MQIQVKVETPSSISRKFNITVPASEISSRYERSLREVSKTAKIKGFRPGHVPMTVVKQVYGTDVMHQLFHSLVDESFNKAARDHQIRPVGRPTIETAKGNAAHGVEHAHDDHGLELGKDLSFSATVEVIPEIEVKSYTGLTATREKVEIAKDEIEQMVVHAQETQATFTPVERALQAKDLVEFSFEGGILNEGKLEPRADMSGARTMEMGTNQLIPGFEDQMIGMKKDETKTFTIQFPENYHEATLAKASAQFTVSVREIKEKVLPELNPEFTKTIGFDDVKSMRDAFEKNLLAQKTTQSDRGIRNQLLEALVEKNAFDVPQGLVQAQARTNVRELIDNLRQQRFNDQMIAQAIAQEQEGLTKRADQQVRVGLLLEAVSKKEKIEISQKEIKSECERMSKEMNMKAEDIEKFYESNAEQRDNLVFRLRQEAALEVIVSKAKIK